MPVKATNRFETERFDLVKDDRVCVADYPTGYDKRSDLELWSERCDTPSISLLPKVLETARFYLEVARSSALSPHPLSVEKGIARPEEQKRIHPLAALPEGFQDADRLRRRAFSQTAWPLPAFTRKDTRYVSQTLCW